MHLVFINIMRKQFVIADNFLFLMVYHTMRFVLSWKRIMHFKAEKLLHFLRYAVSFLFGHRFSAL